MNNNLLQIKIKQRLNKLASFDYDNIECWQIQEAVNKAQLEWIRRQIYGINTRKEGSEQSTGLVDDLQVLLKSKKVDPVDKKYFYEGELPDDYLYYVRVDAFATKDCCTDKRRMVIYQTEEANMGILLTSDTKGPSFEWGETLATLVGNTVRVYTNDEFEITDFTLTYFRKPVEVLFKDCINPSTGTINLADQECELKDDIAEIIVDQAATILAGDIESITQYQRGQQNVQLNS
jgi:hypothetical protein